MEVEIADALLLCVYILSYAGLLFYIMILGSSIILFRISIS